MGEQGKDDVNHLALLPSRSSSSASSSSMEPTKPSPERTGTVSTAVAHIITAVIGSGVLSLAWSMSQLGWIAGPLCMLVFASLTLTSAFLLSNCYRSPILDNGTARHGSYVEAVRAILGKKSGWACALVVRLSLFKTAVIYTITSGISMRAIRKSNCYHAKGHEAACAYGHTFYMLLFGGLQVMVSQIPNFRNTEWLSVVAATMSFSYSIIGSALGLAKVIGNGEVRGSIEGVPASSTAQKVWSICQAVGDIAYAFPFANIFLEIQDTLKSTPPEKTTMKKASIISVFITTTFYVSCGGFGYAAFGNSTPGNLLTGFGFYEPYWLIDFANVCVVLHLVGGYQVFSQPLFAAIERWFTERFPNCRIMYSNYSLKLPLMPSFKLSLLRLCFRTAYVGLTTAIGVVFPYFNQVVGVAGAISFWPAVIYFPVEMYLVQKDIGSWTRKWIFLRSFSFVCLLVSMFALVGSIEGLITAKLS